ncbi:hypothetical protein [Micromonospora cathayae]|uniref:RICIN domain-containing protein n=1 Tax=Micromonospora cathayae TaxID=3028804 RepID=A0ABY7ZNW4_9ACTN|nr:hypothetical protein [Micromonospora sp. HUAS 3]WDZ83639.1 hypothetical protein PVK37_24710 [Micromonospora sp. HUAS 3]
MAKREWLTTAGLVASTLTMAGCGTTGAPDTPGASGATPDLGPTPSAATTAGTPSAAPSRSTPSAGTSSAGTPSATATARPDATSPVLSGRRQVTIVRVDAFESGLSLGDDGRLTEVDDDSGRQLFVPTPVNGKYLIKAYRGSGGGPGAGEPVCWRVHNPGDTRPLSVDTATCRTDDPRQQFEIAPAATGGERAYVISNAGAFLRTSARNGLILEELGDAPPANSFRFTDNGPAPA